MCFYLYWTCGYFHISISSTCAFLLVSTRQDTSCSSHSWTFDIMLANTDFVTRPHVQFVFLTLFICPLPTGFSPQWVSPSLPELVQSQNICKCWCTIYTCLYRLHCCKAWRVLECWVITIFFFVPGWHHHESSGT